MIFKASRIKAALLLQTGDSRTSLKDIHKKEIPYST